MSAELIDEPTPGDVNLDGVEDFSDFLILRDSFGEPSLGWGNGDFDFNFRVNFNDFLILSDNFGAQTATTQGVPEPSGWLLVVASLIGISPLMRRRSPD